MDAELCAALAMLEAVDPRDLQAHRASLQRLRSESDGFRSGGVVIDDLDPSEGPGSPPVRVRRYRSLHSPLPAPTMLWLHGGAFALGFPEVDDDLCSRLAAATDYVVISPDYRLAPEHPFPAGFEDCHAVANWLLRFPDIAGADTSCLVVGGSSAGGGLAASLCIRLRDDGDNHVLQQILACPVIDDRLTSDSMQRFRETPVFDRGQAELMWERYLAGWQGPTPPYAAAGRCNDLRGLPPTYIATAEEDPLRDEGIAYAMRLLQSGVSVELHQFAGTFHSFDTVVPTASVSQRAFDDYVAVLRRVAGKP